MVARRVVALLASYTASDSASLCMTIGNRGHATTLALGY